MLIRILVSCALLFLGGLAPVHAQDAMVVQTCGTLPQAYSAGATRLPTVDVNGKLCMSGSGGTPATGNITLYVATTGSDSNPCSSGAKCLTLQHAVNVASGYNYQNLYAPTINVADGTYGSTQVLLPALVNCPAGGIIVGNTTTWANVVANDGGTAAVFTGAPNAFWFISGMRLGGTFGAFSVPELVFASIGFDKIDFHGGGTALFMGPLSSGGIWFAGGAATVSSTAMNFFIQSNGFISPNSATLTFLNPIVFANQFIWIDATTAFIAGFDWAIVGGANVSCSQVCLHMSSGAFFEAFSGTTVDGTLMSRANFPGHASGFAIDATSIFAPDYVAIYGGSITNNVIGLIDTTGTMQADYNQRNGGAWTFSAAGGGNFGASLILNASAPSFFFRDQETNGHDWSWGAAVTGTTSYTSVYDNSFNSFIGTGAMAWNFDGNYSTQIASNSAYGWASTAIAAQGAVGGAMDTAFSRDSAGVIDVGNGTVGNKSGTLQMAHITATALANSATTSAVCYNVGTGVFTYDGTVGTCTTSDERLKNIGPRIDDALDRLLKINGFYFTYKDPDKYGHGQQIGVGAQTVEKVFPELVSTDSDGIKSVAYDKLVAPIIEALRDLKKDDDATHACLGNWRCRLFGMK